MIVLIVCKSQQHDIGEKLPVILSTLHLLTLYCTPYTYRRYAVHPTLIDFILYTLHLGLSPGRVGRDTTTAKRDTYIAAGHALSVLLVTGSMKRICSYTFDALYSADAAAGLGRNPVSKHQIQPEYGDEQADARQDCRTRLARPNSQARTRTRKYSFFPVQLTTNRIGNLTWLIHTLAICVTVHADIPYLPTAVGFWHISSKYLWELFDLTRIAPWIYVFR